MYRNGRVVRGWVLCGTFLSCLGGFPGAAEARDQSSRVISSRKEVSFDVAYPGGGTPPGPVVLRLPHLAEIFVSACLVPNPPMQPFVLIALRNISGKPLDATGLTFADVNTGEQIGTPTGGIFAPGQEGHFIGGDGELDYYTVLLGVGEGANSRVASITVSAIIDHVRSLCRFNAQAIVPSTQDE